jgi:hypothetical protein
MPTYREKALQARENMRDNKMVQWVRDHRVPIGVGVGGLAFGYLLRGKTINVAPSFNNTVAPVITPVFNNTVNNGGYARKIIRCVETDELWPSMSKAAESAGHTLQAMSRHIHGFNDHLDGLHYVIEGVTAS